MRVCFVVTTPFVLNGFVAPTIRSLLLRGDGVTVVVNTKASPISSDLLEKVEWVNIEIVRSINIVKDVTALWKLFLRFRQDRFDIVHSVTPKAGLLGMLAAMLARTPIRIHTFTGQVWATKRGHMRVLLRCLDRLLAQCATALLVDSHSQLAFLESEKIAKHDQMHVLGSGSISGVDTTRFKPDAVAREVVRSQHGIPLDALLLLYVGRMHPEKGVIELVQAFLILSNSHPEIHLMLVGPDEGVLHKVHNIDGSLHSRIHIVGLTAQPEKYMAAADIFCLASYREGFGLSLIEAAATGLPCVASRIYGVTDAVVDGVNGLLVNVKDVKALVVAVETLAEQPWLRMQMGADARSRATKEFSQDAVVRAWLDFYQLQLLRKSSNDKHS